MMGVARCQLPKSQRRRRRSECGWRREGRRWRNRRAGLGKAVPNRTFSRSPGLLKTLLGSMPAWTRLMSQCAGRKVGPKPELQAIALADGMEGPRACSDPWDLPEQSCSVLLLLLRWHDEGRELTTNLSSKEIWANCYGCSWLPTSSIYCSQMIQEDELRIGHESETCVLKFWSPRGALFRVMWSDGLPAPRRQVNRCSLQ